MSSKRSVVRKGSRSRKTEAEQMVKKGLREEVPASRAATRVYASDGAECPRRAVKHFLASGTNVITSLSKTYMKMGVAIHELIAEGLRGSGVLIFEEYRLPKLEKAPDLRGIIDILWIDKDKEIKGMELKSCGALPSRPKPGYIYQAQTYSAYTGFPFSIFYLSRHVAGRERQLLIKEFEVDCSDEALLETMTRVCTIPLAYKAERLPPIPSELTKRDCIWCPYKEQCWGDGDEPWPEMSSTMMKQHRGKAERRAKQILDNRENVKKQILDDIANNDNADGQTVLKSLGYG